jgi:hypothetical protein
MKESLTSNASVSAKTLELSNVPESIKYSDFDNCDVETNDSVLLNHVEDDNPPVPPILNVAFKADDPVKSKLFVIF